MSLLLESPLHNSPPPCSSLFPSRLPPLSCCSEHRNLVIRRSKLYYLAPELMRTLKHFPDPADLNTPYESFQHTEETDIYAFG